jgi:hypothetical protein
MGSMSEADGKGAYLLTSTYLVLVFLDLNMSESSRASTESRLNMSESSRASTVGATVDQSGRQTNSRPVEATDE